MQMRVNHENKYHLKYACVNHGVDDVCRFVCMYFEPVCMYVLFVAVFMCVCVATANACCWKEAK